MTRPDPEVAVVVPTRDRADALHRCLAALDTQRGANVEIVVVDDASHDPHQVASVVAASPRARLVRGEGRGPAVARNLGAAAARAPIVCFTDDDCRPTPVWAATMAGCLLAGADVVAGPTWVGDTGDRCSVAAQTIINHVLAASTDPATGHPRFAPTCNLGLRAVLQRDVPFDETFPLAAGEDREWCERLASRGIAIHFAPDARVDHHPELGLRGFWRQQVRYGRGAQHLRGRRRGANLQRPGFYVDLLRAGFDHGPGVGALVGLAQVATAAGTARELLSARAGVRPPSR